MKVPLPVLSIGGVLANVLIRTLRRTMRIRYEGRERILAYQEQGQPYILAFWHSRLLLMRYSYPGTRINILSSLHRDAEIISGAMRLFGISVVRGSTTRGGAAALREVVRRVRAGADAAFTPDGPRGPSGSAQMGVIQAARLAGVSIVPVGFGASKKKI